MIIYYYKDNNRMDYDLKKEYLNGDVKEITMLRSCESIQHMKYH